MSKKKNEWNFRISTQIVSKIEKKVFKVCQLHKMTSGS